MAVTRNETIDIMKGIGITLVIIGHMSDFFYLHKFIYSFHMPLFFILAGYFFSPREGVKEGLVKDVRRLLIPYFSVILLLLIYSIFTHGIQHNFSQLLQSSILLMWIFPDGLFLQESYQVPVIPVWFLLSLFWCKSLFRIIYKYIKEPYLFIVILIISSIGVFVNIKLPFAFMQGVIASFFYGVGFLMKGKRIEENKVVILSVIIIWSVCLVWVGLDMAYGYYKLYILELFGALGGTFFIYLISIGIKHVKRISNFLQWFGINSLIVLCVHSLERYIPIWSVLRINNYFLLLVCKVSLCSIAILLSYRLKITKYIFRLK